MLNRPRRRQATRAVACGWAILFSTVLDSALAATPAPGAPTRPTTKVECVKANADAQALRMDGELAAARAQLELCQSASCPALVRDDCAQRMDDLDHAQPTLVFDVRDSAGADVSNVAISQDGVPLSGQLAGGAIRVDPGPHDYVIQVAGAPPVTRRLVVKEGEKDRREVVVVGRAPAPAVEAVPGPAATTAEPSRRGLGTRRVLALGAAGAGLTAVAAGSIFGVMTYSAVSQQKTDCASTTDCKSPAQALSDHASSVTDGTVSTALFVAAGVLVGGAAVLFFTAPPRPGREEAAWVVAPAAGPAGGGVSLHGSF